MYERILTPVDGSLLAEAVLPYVRLLAEGLEARVELLRVVEPMRHEFTDQRHGLHLDRFVDAMRVQARSYLDELALTLSKEGLSVSTHLREGNVAPIIVAEAQAQPGTLLAMSTHGRSGVARWLLGSVTDKVLRASDTPLLIVRPPEDYGSIRPAEKVHLGTVVVPLDGSKAAEEALVTAVWLARALGLKTALARVTPAEEEYHRILESHYELGPGPTVARVYEGPYEEFSASINADAMEYLHGVAHDLRQQGARSVEEHLLFGDVSGAIVNLASEQANSLVVMSTHGRSGLGRWVMGSNTDRVVRHSHVPVLVIRSTEDSGQST